MSSRRVRIHRVREFSAAHRYFDRGLSLKENLEFYGACTRAQGFGRNFRLEAGFSGPIDPLSGMIVNLVEIDQWMAKVVGVLESRFLNELESIFAGQAPTAERIAEYCFDQLDANLPSASELRLEHVRLYEDEALSLTVLS